MDTNRRLVCPFTLTVEPMAAMLNFEIADDPTYSGLEIQRFADDVHGRGIVVLLMRRDDGRVDVYRQAGLRIDRGGYGIGAGIGRWQESDIAPARLEVTPTGVVGEVALRDADGRLVEARVDDRSARRRSPASLLAPVSAGIERPTAMLLVWMPRFDLVRTDGRRPVIRIDGRPVAIGRLPGAWLHRRHLIKYAADLVVVQLNPAINGPAATVDPAAPRGVGVERGDETYVITRVAARTVGHEARLELSPPLPDITRVPDGAASAGRWRLGIDRTAAVVSGTWSVRRSGQSVDLTFRSTAPWRPGPLPLLMRIVTTIVPTFRAWPLTYRWHGTLALDDAGHLKSHWERVGTERGAAYRRLTGSADVA